MPRKSNPRRHRVYQELLARSRVILFDELLNHFLEIWITGPRLLVSQFPPRSATLSPSAITSNWPVLPGVQIASIFRRCLIRVTRLATLALLFCHVGQ
jgi:hypothetical protein